MLHSKMTKMDYVIEAVLIVIGAIVCICILYPILNILAISISADGPVLRHDVRLIPQGFTLKAYKDILKNEQYFAGIWKFHFYHRCRRGLQPCGYSTCSVSDRLLRISGKENL